MANAHGQGLGEALDAMVGTLHNGTSPGAHLDARRGVVSGGSAVMRAPITQIQPLTLSPPEGGGGCSGIDLYGGSLSFISQNQFTALLRTIAANAGGYAFQLGINAMCPDCGSLMSDLQRKVQSMNELFSNSCQLAQGLVNDGVSAIEAQQQARLSTLSIQKGLGDVFESFTSQGSAARLKQIQNSDPTQFRSTITGNLAWRALKTAEAARWFPDSDTEWLEAVMSLTGSLVIEASGGGREGPLTVTRLPPLLDLEALVDGSDQAPKGREPRRYRCERENQGADGCLKPVLERLQEPGLRARLEAFLLGGTETPGLVRKFATGEGTLTEAETGFLAFAPGGIGALIRTLARDDPALAEHFAQRVARQLALEMANALVAEMIAGVREASRLSDHAYARLFLDSLEEIERQTLASVSRRRAQDGTLAELMRETESLRATARPRRYGTLSGLEAGPRVIAP